VTVYYQRWNATNKDQMASPCSSTTFVSLRLQFLKEVLAIPLPLVPPLCEVRQIRIKPVVSFATKLSFFVGNSSRDPTTNGSFGHAETTCNLFARKALFSQFEQLLIPI
jgi:hypothetical protein